MLKRVVLIGGVAVTAATLAFAADPPKLPFTVSEETTGITRPLKVDGSPDYIAALNERYGKDVTPENNGFVEWLRVVGTGDGVLSPKVREQTLRLLGMAALPREGNYLKVFSQELTAQRKTPAEVSRLDEDFNTLWKRLWSPTDHPEAAAFLKQQNAVLDRVVRATEKPHWWVPAAGDNMIGIVLPSVGQLRNAANLLATRATQRATAGDFEGFQEDVLAIKRLARQVASSPTLNGHLISIGINGLGNYPAGAAAGSGRLTEAQSKALDEQLLALPPMPRSSEAVDTSERWTQLDLMQIAAKGDGGRILSAIGGKDEQTIKLLNGVIPGDINWDIVLRLTNGQIDSIVKAMQATPLKSLKEETGGINNLVKAQFKEDVAKGPKRGAKESLAEYSARIGRVLNGLYIPSLGKSEELRRRNVLHDQMTHLLLLAAQVHAKTGHWPARLEELAPAMIKEIPKDLYPVENPGPLLYTVTNVGATISTHLENEPRFYVGAERPPAPGAEPTGSP